MNELSIDTGGQTTRATQIKLDRLRETSGRIVGSVFFGTLLKTMRESNIKGSFGHGGRGEEVFSAQLHGILAERMGAAERGGLGEALYRAFERQTRLIGNAAARDQGKAAS